MSYQIRAVPVSRLKGNGQSYITYIPQVLQDDEVIHHDKMGSRSLFNAYMRAWMIRDKIIERENRHGKVP